MSVRACQVCFSVPGLYHLTYLFPVAFHIYIVAHDRISLFFMAGGFNHSSIAGHIGCFHILAPKKSAGLNMKCAYLFSFITLFFMFLFYKMCLNLIYVSLFYDYNILNLPEYIIYLIYLLSYSLNFLLFLSHQIFC